MSARRLQRDERGAVAVVVGLLMVLVVSIASLAVDLGNAWARAREVQRQVDVSATSAGHLLPKTLHNGDEIAAEVASFLNRNQVRGGPVVTPAQLLNGVLDDGEVRFFDRGGAPCTDRCPRMTVTAPRAEVDFAFAGTLGLAETTVQRSATVLVVSELPPKEKTIPLWLPAGCGYGPVDGDTTGGQNPPSVVTPTPTPTPTPTSPSAPTASTTSPAPPPTSTPSPVVVVSPRGNHEINGLSPINVTQGGLVGITGYRIDDLANNTAKATIRMVAPDGSRFVDYATSTSVPKSWMAVAPFDVGPEVTATPGDWTVYAVVQANGNNKPLQYSSNNLVLHVEPGPWDPPTTEPEPTEPTDSSDPEDPATTPTSGTTNVPVGCAGQNRGNFGQLYSPRAETTNKNAALALNFALGIDHTLLPFDTTKYTVEKECATSNGRSVVDGAQLDDVSRDGNNCIIGDTGNDGPRMFDGIISGVTVGATHHPGRLDVANGPTTCPLRPTLVRGGVELNNDVLSCFLRDGATLSDIAQESGVTPSMLDPAILRSPRLVYLPVVLATDRAQKGYQPIIDFVPAFITDETQTSPATADNGLQINGNSIKVIRLFAFNKDALPIDEGSPDADYVATLERPIVRLVG